MAPSYDELRKQLCELNYMYEFPPGAYSLVNQLVSDLISTVGAYKALEKELVSAGTSEKRSREKENNLNISKNQRKRSSLTASLEGSSTSLISSLRSDLCARDETILRMELMQSQLNHKLAESVRENAHLRTRVDQLLLGGEGSRDLRAASIVTCDYAERLVPWGAEEESVDEATNFISLSGMILSLQEKNSGLVKSLENALAEIGARDERIKEVEGLMMSGEPDGSSAKLFASQLDYLNEKYRELQDLHSRCGVGTDSPLVDLRESKKELNLVQVRYEKMKRELAVAQQEVERLKRLKRDDPREIKELKNLIALKEKELKLLKAAPSGHSSNPPHDLLSQICLLEEKLSHVTEDRNELLSKLDEIERTIGAMETDVGKIEQENAALKRERARQEKAFIGISEQLAQVNEIMNSLGDGEQLERANFKIKQLEEELRNRQDQLVRVSDQAKLGHSTKSVIEAQLRELNQRLDEETAKRAEVESDLRNIKNLLASVTSARDGAVDRSRQLEYELQKLQSELTVVASSSAAKSRLEADYSLLKKTVADLDRERDKLQSVCDQQSEQLHALRELNAKIRTDLAGTQKQVSSSKFEAEKLATMLSEKDREFQRMQSALTGSVATLEQRLRTAQRDSDELARMNQTLSVELRAVQLRLEEVGRMHLQATNSWKTTEAEKSQLSTQYKQLVIDTKSLQESYQKCELQRKQLEAVLSAKSTAQEQLSKMCNELQRSNQIAQQELATLRTQDRPTNSTLENQIAQLNQKLESEIDTNNLQEYIQSLENARPRNDLEQLIEQQYALIGQMDAEQARLIVELNQLRERLSANPPDNS